MREPRPRQRFPAGGKALYELLRRDYEPLFIMAWDASHVFHSRHHERPRDRRGYTEPEITAQRYCDEHQAQAGTVYSLAFELSFDPMLYFWPVERQHVITFLEQPIAEPDVKRLARALKRDGATVITIMWSKPEPVRHVFGDPEQHLKERTDIQELLQERSRKLAEYAREYPELRGSELIDSFNRSRR